MQPDYNIWRMASSLSVIFSYTPSYTLPVPRMYSTTSGRKMQLMLRATKLNILRELQIHVCNYTAEQVPAWSSKEVSKPDKSSRSANSVGCSERRVFFRELVCLKKVVRKKIR
jgi:hypothetical protein